MSIRTSLPESAKRLVRTAYVGLGGATAGHRLRPELLVIGGQRCGTTSLFRALEQHPQLVRPTFNKGINYFDINYHRGGRWYAGHFPTVRSARKRAGVNARSIAFDASGYYMFHPLAAERIARDLPDVKIVAMLRDPVERAYSAWKHEHARGFDDEPFEQALELEEERTRGEVDRMIAEPRYQSYSHRHHSYAARGDYATQLRLFYARMPESQIHVVYSEDFFDSPESEFRRLTDFLGIDHVEGLTFDRHNARHGAPLPERAREILAERYAGQADRLEAMVGRRPPWEELPSPSAGA